MNAVLLEPLIKITKIGQNNNNAHTTYNNNIIILANNIFYTERVYFNLIFFSYLLSCRKYSGTQFYHFMVVIPVILL